MGDEKYRGASNAPPSNGPEVCRPAGRLGTSGPDADEMDQVFAAGGEVGRLMAGMDWSATALGPVHDWSPTLRTAVSMCVESRFPIQVLWGPDFIQLYNDALLPHIGQKHPDCLGRPFRENFPELQDAFIPMLNQVISEGAATWSQDWRIMLHRYGYLEECYLTFSYSPIRQIPGGTVVGILTASQETTRQVLGTRRLSCLRELASATAGRHTPGEVFTHAVDVLGRYPADVPYCLIMSSDPDAPQSLLPAASSGLAAAPQTTSGPAAGGLDVGGPAVGGLDAAVPELADSLDSGEIRIVDRLLERLGSHRTNATPPSTSAAAVPLTEGGDMPTIGLLVAGLSDHLPVDDDYRTFISLAATQITAAAATARAVEMERVMAADARRRALHDGLTGLPNRAALFEQLQQTIAESERARRQHVGFLFVDLDGFKSVNDTLGHHAGDELLREVAERLRQAVRPNDTVARISGDEFAVLCQNITSRKALETIAGRVINSVAIVRTTSTETIKVTASVGIAMTGPDISNPDDLVRAADTAMYAAKRRGRHCWQHFDASTPIHQPRPRS